MIGDESDQSDYPYAAPPGLSSGATTAATSLLRWRSLPEWFARALIVFGILFFLAVIGGGILAYRSARQAWLVAEVERNGGSVSYWHQPPASKEMLPQTLRERLGDHWLSSVREVSHDIFFFGNRSDLTADNVEVICRACRTFPALKSFSINTDCFSCDKISNWPQLSQIEELRIGSSGLSDADMAIVGRMKSLKSLKIGAAKISSEGIAHLANLPRLEQLSFESVRFDKSNLKQLQGFQSLKSFVISRAPDVDDDFIVSLGPLPQLEEVNFNKTSIGDRGLAQLVRRGDFREVIIHEGKLTDGSLEHLAKFTAPRWVVLSGMPLTDSGLKALSGKEFSTLILDHTSITDAGLRALAEIRGLDYVVLADTRVTGIGAADLPSDKPLAHLDLSGAALTQEGIATLAKMNASALCLARTAIDNKQLMLFANNDYLANLDVTETHVTADGVRAFYMARKRRLQTVNREEILTLECDFPEAVESFLRTSTNGVPPGGDGVESSPVQ